MLEAYLTLSGRMRRMPYFGYSLLAVPILGLIGGIGASLVGSARFPIAASIAVFALLAMLIVWIGVALGVKRCHDLDKSGWLYFWIVLLPGVTSTTVSINLNGVHSEYGLPVIGSLAGLVCFGGGMYLLFARGTDGRNRYGFPPEAR